MNFPSPNPILKPYLGNPSLKAIGVPIQFTPEQVQEYVKCRDNPIYFIENYVKIVNLDRGLVTFKCYDYQKEVIDIIHKNRYSIAKWPRQSGKCFCKGGLITVRNKKTNEIRQMSVEAFYSIVEG